MPDDQNPQLPLNPPGDDGKTPPQGPGAANIQPINIEEEMRRSYLDYSMSVIIGRALPDVRDGLKPVHRRILYTMQLMGLYPNRATRKCARIVGDVMGKFHPHGNLAVYDALVRLAQTWSMRYPLVFGQGNFGSVDGDPPAADRYTESKLGAIAAALLEDLDKDTVDMQPNYDDNEIEPTVLPTKFPNLIVNGSDGIAVGMATKIPPHNLTEIVDATILLVNDPKTPLLRILEVVKGPDFPTGAYIYGKGGIAEAYKHGRGRFIMRAKAAIENLTKDRQAIIITEIPYQVNKARLIERIADLVNDKIVDDVSDIRDESDRDGMRIVIELKRGAQPEIILNQLYKHTAMQESFSMIFLAVVNGQPKELGLIAAIQHFIDHRVEVVRRRTAFLLMKAKEREHILEGYRIALDNLDAIIKLIRASQSRQDAKENLLAAKFKITDKEIVEKAGGREGKLTAKQADAILDLQLHRLTRLSADEILNELKDIRENIAEYESILASEKKLRGVIIKELEEIRKQYGDERRTQILDEAAEIQLEDLIQEEQVAVTVTHTGYLKRTPISTYRSQRRGGTGRKGAGVREEDFVEYLFIASTHAYLLIFTNTGRVYWLKVYEVPDVGAAGKGKHVSNLVALQPGESVRAMLPVRDLEEAGKHVFFATRQGTVKKTPLVDFSNVMSRGIIAIGIEKEDELVAAACTDGNQIIFLASHEGMSIRFDEEDVRPMGRPAYGVRGMDLDKKDYVIGMAVTAKQLANANGSGKAVTRAETKAKADAATAAGEELPPADKILSVTENGYGKRTPVDEYRLQSRGGKGVINVKTTERNGRVVSILLVSDQSEAMVISQYGKIIRIDTKEIREAGRSTQGVRLLSMEGGDKVAAAVVIPPEETNGNGNGTPSLIQ
ncbi:MAG: DNA gyrase subunit A [Acidobacteriia bacterium]|nr:DNA gyrase subunit A [Terriglobia bacterium]